jgi:hypothetical protein
MNTQEQLRIQAGLQCPECYGVRITKRSRQPHEPQGFQCEECGCNWSEQIADASVVWLHPYCNTCGWRKGGQDSWNGKTCKCGETAPLIRLVS